MAIKMFKIGISTHSNFTLNGGQIVANIAKNVYICVIVN